MTQQSTAAPSGGEISARPWALVAGASGGIGAAVCDELGKQGWNLVLTHRANRDKAEATAKTLIDSGADARTEAIDLSDDDAVQALVDAVEREHGLSRVVYAAEPHIHMDYVSKLSVQRMRDQLNDDAVACFALLQASLAALRRRASTIVAVSTPAVARYPKRELPSSATKAAVEALVRAIAAEEGRFNVRAPGRVRPARGRYVA